MASRTVHLYCTVIDNFGDIGVCWRLARQLVGEYQLDVHLWVDHWPAARMLIPELPDASTLADDFRVSGVAIRPWTRLRAEADCVGDVLIEGFGLTLPEITRAQLAARTTKPLWINLEYFSAEEWVPRFHLQSGFDRDVGARLWFFFPGVAVHSGGLLRERELLAQRDAWLAEGQAASFLAKLGLADAYPALKVMCFAYANAPYAVWLDVLAAQSPTPLSIWLAGGYSQAAFAQLNLNHAPLPNTTLHNLPFVSQLDFDHLLWSADLLWVRGEDSLVRALWSGKPFIWHIYPQAENAHHAKLDAWLADYTAPFPTELREAYLAVHHAWNGVTPASELADAWPRLMTHWADWRLHSLRRSGDYARAEDLASRLISFIRTFNSSTKNVY